MSDKQKHITESENKIRINKIENALVNLIRDYKNAKKLTELPSTHEHKGYRITSTIPQSIIPFNLTSSIKHNICRIHIPCAGVWLVQFEIILFNPRISINNDIVEDTHISYMCISISIGKNSEVQFIPQILFIDEARQSTLYVGENRQIRSSEIFTANGETILSFNMQVVFSGRNIYYTNNFGQLPEIYNLSATRIA